MTENELDKKPPKSEEPKDPMVITDAQRREIWLQKYKVSLIDGYLALKPIQEGLQLYIEDAWNKANEFKV